MGHSDVLLRQVPGAETSLIISSFSNLYLKETEVSQYLPRVLTACLCLCLWRSVNKLNGTHNLPAACRHVSFTPGGVFQMGERYQAYHGYYWLFHLPDQILFPILAPSQSADFVVSSSGTANSLYPMNSASMSSFCTPPIQAPSSAIFQLHILQQLPTAVNKSLIFLNFLISPVIWLRLTQWHVTSFSALLAPSPKAPWIWLTLKYSISSFCPHLRPLQSALPFCPGLLSHSPLCILFLCYCSFESWIKYHFLRNVSLPLYILIRHSS